MSQNEDYLDSLLRSVTSYKREYNKKTEIERELLSRELEDLSDISDLDRQMDLIMDSSGTDDDEFLLEFEQELSEDQLFGNRQKEYKPETVAEHGKEELEFFDQLEKEIRPPSPKEEESVSVGREALPEGMETVFGGTEDLPEGTQALPEETQALPEGMDEMPSSMDGFLQQESVPELLTPEIEALMKEDSAVPDGDENNIPLPEGMVMPEVIGDGSQEDIGPQEEQGLMDLLSGLSDADESISEIENLLKADEENIDIGGVLNMPQEVEGTLESEDGSIISDGSEISSEAGELLEEMAASGGKKKKKKKKEKKQKNKDADQDGEPSGIKALFAKIKNAFHGSDETEGNAGSVRADGTVALPEDGSLESLSDENREILQELTAAEKEKKKGKAKRAKKENMKKEKTKKEPKEKKESKPKKPKKPKKEKQPKEKLPPVPVPLLVVAIVLGVSLSALIYFFSGMTGSEMIVSEAETYFGKGEYTLAYESIEGTEITERNQELYDKIRLMAYISQERDSFYYFQQIGEYECALDALVRGVMRYEKYVDEAASYGLEDQYQKIEEEIVLRLADTFLLSVDNAKELADISDREEYTKQVYAIVAQLGFHNEEGLASAQVSAQ